MLDENSKIDSFRPDHAILHDGSPRDFRPCDFPGASVELQNLPAEALCAWELGRANKSSLQHPALF
jgi:hypothetical protein